MLPVRVGIHPAPGDIPSVHRDSLENGDYVVATGKGGALFLQELVSEGVVSRQVSPNDLSRTRLGGRRTSLLPPLLSLIVP